MNIRRFLALVSIAILISCQPDREETFVDLSSYQVADGLVLEAVAAEPLIEAPVAMSFDAEGRMWVVEMAGYMRTLEGVNEDAPVSRILYLEDLDEDGQMDHAVTFLDSLVLARAIAHVYGGLLYAEPPNLWFIEINEDLSPGQRTLVDSTYAVGGNVEHQPNGLLHNIDNWIYNAKATKRYRRKDGQWRIENTAFRGQWGITKDEVGRLIYNDNSNQARGDFVLSNTLQNVIGSKLLHQKIVHDERVYPLQPTAVNRGYINGVLNADSLLTRFTSACGPLYFQGELLPDDYQSNVLVCGPEANLIKRNILTEEGFRLKGKQAWEGKEMIVSSDEGFRPVNLFNGPDGALYIVDMHRGLIQHKAYMTEYLRDQYIRRGLDSLVGMGRILKVTSIEGKAATPKLSKANQSELMNALQSPNIWVRDKAQQLLIQRNDPAIVEQLVEMVYNAPEISAIHAFYVLEGMNQLLNINWDVPRLTNKPWLIAHLLKQNTSTLSDQEIELLNNQESQIIRFYLTYYLAQREGNKAQLSKLINLSDPELTMEALASSPYLFQIIDEMEDYPEVQSFLKEQASARDQQSKQTTLYTDELTQGLTLYRQYCATCHGPDGKGIVGLAPPLLKSEYVGGQPEQLAAIMLYGLKGPLTVAGKSYDLATAMPGLKSNTELSNQDIRDIGNYVRNAFTTSPQNLTNELVQEMRELDRAPTKMYTAEELKDEFEIRR